MDNASKALIMAGAILIAVALVGVGVFLYSSAVGQVDNATQQLSASEIQLKNSEFEVYETGPGETISGSEARTLVRKINSFNSQNVFPDPITCNITNANTINTTQRYTVTITYATSGPNYITEIAIN